MAKVVSKEAIRNRQGQWAMAVCLEKRSGNPTLQLYHQEEVRSMNTDADERQA